MTVGFPVAFINNICHPAQGLDGEMPLFWVFVHSIASDMPTGLLIFGITVQWSWLPLLEPSLLLKGWTNLPFCRRFSAEFILRSISYWVWSVNMAPRKPLHRPVSSFWTVSQLPPSHLAGALLPPQWIYNIPTHIHFCPRLHKTSTSACIPIRNQFPLSFKFWCASDQLGFGKLSFNNSPFILILSAWWVEAT